MIRHISEFGELSLKVADVGVNGLPQLLQKLDVPVDW